MRADSIAITPTTFLVPAYQVHVLSSRRMPHSNAVHITHPCTILEQKAVMGRACAQSVQSLYYRLKSDKHASRQGQLHAGMSASCWTLRAPHMSFHSSDLRSFNTNGPQRCNRHPVAPTTQRDTAPSSTPTLLHDPSHAHPATDITRWPSSP